MGVLSNVLKKIASTWDLHLVYLIFYEFIPIKHSIMDIYLCVSSLYEIVKLIVLNFIDDPYIIFGTSYQNLFFLFSDQLINLKPFF